MGLRKFLAACCAFLPTAAAAETPGYRDIAFHAPHHGREVRGAIFYPAGGEGRARRVGANAVFNGVETLEDAPPRPGVHPVVLLSHGLGGSFHAQAWLAAGLAARGAVVVAVDHPNSSRGDFDLAAGLRHWTRAQDLSAALDALLADPDFSGRLDPARVMAAGFSYGGWTALSLAGLRGDREAYRAHCETYGAASSHCGDLMRAGISLAEVDPALWAASWKDARVTHAFAIDPGLVWGLGPAQTADLVGRVGLVGLGAGADRLLATDFDASGFAALAPAAGVARIAPASHFAALPTCTPVGAAILEAEGDDPVCDDPPGVDRATVHAAIVALAAADLGL